MSDFTQQRFMGASICSFNASLGWSNQISTLTVNLVEDSVVGDVFVAQTVGTPLQFNYQGWIFNGILQSYKRNDSSGGSPLYEVTLIDPREVLEGVQLIIGGYTGFTFGVKNVMNIYGYLESFGFGNSDINESGMSWSLIANTLQTITNNLIYNDYGGPIKFLNSQYAINLTQLPQLPYQYRVGGDNITVMDFITDVCESACCDFFFTLGATSGSTFEIQVNVVNRQVAQNVGQIQNFINAQGNVVGKNVGVELVNGASGKFVVGGPVEQIYIQYEVFDSPSGEDVSHTKFRDQTIDVVDGTIWPFWGFDADGNATLGTGQYNSNEHFFYIDSRMFNVFGVGAYYGTDVGEMRAALDSFETWSVYIENKSSQANSIHFGKAQNLGLVSALSTMLTILNGGKTPAQAKQVPWARFGAITKRQARLVNGVGIDDQMLNLNRLYDYVRAYASEFYGKKFMVRVPFIYVKADSDTGKVTLSQEPHDSGFLDESEWADAIDNNLLPIDIDRLMTEEGKIEGYVRFDDTEAVMAHTDMSELNQDDMVVSGDGKSLFVKCKISPGIVYLDWQTQYSPRAVIELSGAVRELGHDDYSGAVTNLVADVLNLDPSVPADKTKIDDCIKQWKSQGASESLYLGMPGLAHLPTMVGLPLKSNIDNYGPWSIQGASGKVDFERDESLTPWNYAGFEGMNVAAQAKIVEALMNQVVSETGTVEFPGVPVVPLGTVLIDGGPLVTDVRVNIAENGATTTYQMQLAPKFGKFAKYNSDRFNQLGKQAQRFRKDLRLQAKIPSAADPFFKLRSGEIKLKPNARNPHTSHTLLNGDVILDDENTLNLNVAAQSNYNAIDQIYEGYERKSVMSMDGLLTPFSTDIANDVEASGLPHFRALSGTADGPTRDSLNRFAGQHGIMQITRDYDFPDSLLAEDGYSPNGIYRGICLRGPVMIGGWGLDTSGNPVPAAPSGDPLNPVGLSLTYPQNVSQRPDLWKVGPLDARWDDARGVWVAGNSSATATMYRAIAKQTILPYTNGSIQLLDGTNVTGNSWLGQPICSGQKLYALKDQGAYYITISEYSSLNVVNNMVCDSGHFTITRSTIYFPSAYASG